MFTRHLNLYILPIFTVATYGCHSNPQHGDDVSKSSPSFFTDGDVIQDISDNKVYLISDNKKHYIKFPVTLQALGATNRIKVEPDSVVASISSGNDTPAITSRVVQDTSTGKVYVLEAGKRHYVPGAATLQKLHFTGQIQGLSGPDADSIPLGTPMAPSP